VHPKRIGAVDSRKAWPDKWLVLGVLTDHCVPNDTGYEIEQETHTTTAATGRKIEQQRNLSRKQFAAGI